MIIGYKNDAGIFVQKDIFLAKMKPSFECKNLNKISQKNMGFYGWYKLPDFIEHYKILESHVRIPMGYFGFRQNQFQDLTTKRELISFPELKGQLKQKQVSSISALMKHPVGLLHASTGVGKTWMVAGIIGALKKKTLIVCDAIGRMTQMKQDLQDIFGVSYRTVSGNKKKQKDVSEDIIIGNIDSLLKLPREYFEQFGVILLDECDRYLQSDKRREWIGGLSPENLYGLTGTIKLNHVEDKVFPLYLGPKVEFLEKNFTPRIHQVHTDFEYSEGEFDDIKEFYKLKQELYECPKRNKLIVDTILSTINNRKAICFTEFIEHAKLIKEGLEAEGIACFLIIGEVSGEDREKIRQEITDFKGSCVLIGSKVCIGRGLNIPELSVGYLTISEKFHSSIDQYVGRIIRNFPGKENSNIDWYDFVDNRVQMLQNQGRARAAVYKREFKTTNFVQHLPGGAIKQSGGTYQSIF